MATTAPHRPPPAPSAPAAGAAPNEDAAAATMTIGAFLLGGPVGGVIFALSVAIERAFGKSGWDKPGWLGPRPDLDPEEFEKTREQRLEEARKYLDAARIRAQERARIRNQHRDSLRDWLNDGRQGDKPDRPEGATRNPWEFIGDLFNTSKSWYRLFDDKQRNADNQLDVIQDEWQLTLGELGDFFRNLWNFITGFFEGLGAGWREFQDRKTPTGQPEETAAPADQPELDPAQDDDRPELNPVPDGPTVVDSELGPEPGPVPTDPTTALPVPGSEGDGMTSGPTGLTEGTLEGDVMTTDGQVALPADGAPVTAQHMGPQGVTNLDLILRAFSPIPPLLNSVARQVPDLQNQQIAITNRLARISALAGVHGAPMQVYAALAQASQVVLGLGTGLRRIGLSNEAARELADEALVGLQPAQEDLATVHAQAASGDLLNRAA